MASLIACAAPYFRVSGASCSIWAASVTWTAPGSGDLVQAYAAVRNRGGVIKLLDVTKRLNDLLVVTRLVTVFDCYDNESEAFQSLNEFRVPVMARLGRS